MPTVARSKKKTFNHYKNFCLMARCQLLAIYLNNTFGGKFFLIFEVGESLYIKWMKFAGLWPGTTWIKAGSSRVNMLHKTEITSQQYQWIPHKMNIDNFLDILFNFPRWNKMWPHNKQASKALTNTSNTFYKGTYVSYARDEIFKISKTYFFIIKGNSIRCAHTSNTRPFKIPK